MENQDSPDEINRSMEGSDTDKKDIKPLKQEMMLKKRNQPSDVKDVKSEA